jgi:hypothetical protein
VIRTLRPNINQDDRDCLDDVGLVLADGADDDLEDLGVAELMPS